MAIYLVRHGETHWNRRHRLQGIRDLPLNRAGVRPARGLAERFRRLTIGSIVTSPLLRARHTALEIRGPRPWPVLVEDDLREIDHGSWTGLLLGSVFGPFRWQRSGNFPKRTPAFPSSVQRVGKSIVWSV